MALHSQMALLIMISIILLSSTNINAHDDEMVAASAPVSQISTAPAETTTTTTTTTSTQSLIDTSTTTTTPPSNKAQTQVEVQATVNKIEKNMKVTMQKTEDVLRVIKKRLAATPGSSRAEDCLKTCIEVYEEAVDGMKDSIEDLSSGNYYKVNVDISAVSTDVDTCDECYTEMLGEDPELQKFDQWIQGVTSECLTDLESVSGR